jgi:asparagine synthase (glutamine-hydrolysing)
MCGIAGIVGEFPERSATVARMTDALRHRGPDDGGTFDDGLCSLGHRRLSIIDLSAAGHQPMSNEDGSIQLTFNGEIYNFQELRSSLVSRGHRFKSRTDTEVLVHLYEERGDAMVESLRGMFAFALWDARRRRLLLARDHFGQKPLFIAEKHGALLFASEIKALLAAGIDREPEPRALDHLMRVQVVPAPLTCFRSIRRLPAATTLVRESNGATREQRFWSLANVAPHGMRFEEVVEEADRLCRLAVREQLVADVPVGIFASGGIDSSIVLMAAAASGQRPQSFTLGYENSELSEVDAATRATKNVDTDHHVVTMQPSDAAHPERLVEIFDEPFSDIAALPLAHLARAARGHVTVALTGDGGDELFGGYPHHILGYWLARLEGLRAVRGRTARTLLRLAGAAGPRAERLRRILDPLTANSWRAAVTRMRSSLVSPVPELYTRAMQDVATQPVEDALFGDGEGVAALFAVSGDRFLADRLLMKTDLAAMSVGLETRSPMLDLRIAELAAATPPALKIRGLQGKQILRRVLARSASRDIWARPKMGFSMPLDSWLKRELRPVVEDTLLAPHPQVAAYLRKDVLARMYREHVDGIANWRKVLWPALLIELWMKRCARISSAISEAIPPAIAR